MAIRVKCPNPACGKQYDLKDDLAGKTVKCTACQQSFQVPAKPSAPALRPAQGGEQGRTADGVTTSALHLGFDISRIEKQAAPADPLLGTKIAHYRIESLLGRGGMGKVYKARNINLNKTCALKILPPEFATQDRSLVDRFIREARSAAAIEHPNVLPVQFVGKVEENYFIEMKYVDGGTLADVLKKRGRLEVKEAARIIRDVAAGLQAAHEKGIVHRDMKASNVMLTNQGHVYVMDFGLAKVAQARSALTQQGDIMGTPLYMSPEQALGATVDRRSDIYSLGVMFYQILSGRPPYTDESALVILEKHRSAPIPDVSSIVREVPAQIGAMIVKMMAKRREDRYQSCAEIVQELNVFVETGTPGLVVSEDVFRDADEARRTMRLGRRPSRPASPRKPLRMTKPLAIGLVLVLVLVLGAVAVYFARQAQRSEVRGQRSGTATTVQTAPAPTQSSALSPQSYDDVYVTTAATGDKIPHPLSRRTHKQTLADGTTVDVPEGMVFVPGGPFVMGGDDGAPLSYPAHEVDVKPFFMDKYEVTNAQYMEFLKATGRQPPKHFAATGNNIPPGRENHPVTFVGWADAKAYCDWCGKRLPTEAEWEKAASWKAAERHKSRSFWGDRGDDSNQPRANWLARWGYRPGEGGNEQKWWDSFTKTKEFQEQVALGGLTMTVGSFPIGISPYKCYDMAGNVWEWTSDLVDRYPGNTKTLDGLDLVCCPGSTLHK